MYLKEIDVVPEIKGYNPILIVACQFCPAVSLAVKNGVPYIDFFRGFLKTAPYEQLIRNLRTHLKRAGIRTKVFENNLPHQFIPCMWPLSQHEKLRRCATEYEALVVLGCEGAVQTVNDSVNSTNCRVFQGMESEGIMNVKPRFHLPLNISVELCGVTQIRIQ